MQASNSETKFSIILSQDKISSIKPTLWPALQTVFQLGPVAASSSDFEPKKCIKPTIYFFVNG